MPVLITSPDKIADTCEGATGCAAGSHTCEYYAGSWGHLTQDVQTVAAWGADYLKMDWCYVGRQSARRTYAHISRTAAATGHPMVFSVSNWGHNAPWD